MLSMARKKGANINVGELRKKLEGVADEMEVVVINDYGHGEIITDYGIGVETHEVCDPCNVWIITVIQHQRMCLYSRIFLIIDDPPRITN